MKTRFTSWMSLTLTSLILAATACSNSGTAEWFDMVRHGDSTLVTIAANADPPMIQCDSFDVLWRSDALEDPVSMVRGDGRIFVADRTRIHVLSEDGTHLSSVGRAGEGPGEFGFTSAIGILGDTVVVLDTRLHRHSLHATDGSYMTSYRVDVPMPFVNPRRDGQVLRATDGGMLHVANENVHLARPTRSAIIWRSVRGDSSRVIREWDDVTWQELGGRFIAHTSAFPSRAIIALGEAGRYAHGDGLEYCLTVETVDGPAVLRICRAWSRVPVGRDTRAPNLDRLPEGSDLSAQMRSVFEVLIREQRVEDERPSYDKLVMGADNSVWVRTIGPEYPDVRPDLMPRVPAWRPSHRVWDVYDANGALQRTVRIIVSFDLRVPGESMALGIGELESGEKVIARVRM